MGFGGFMLLWFYIFLSCCSSYYEHVLYSIIWWLSHKRQVINKTIHSTLVYLLSGPQSCWLFVTDFRCFFLFILLIDCLRCSPAANSCSSSCCPSSCCSAASKESSRTQSRYGTQTQTWVSDTLLQIHKWMNPVCWSCDAAPTHTSSYYRYMRSFLFTDLGSFTD